MRPDDEKFEHWLVETAGDYNQPPAPAPREEMWRSIEARLAATEDFPAAPPVARHGFPRPMTRRWYVAGMSAAAALLLIVGYQWGRGTVSSGDDPPAANIAVQEGATLYARAAQLHLERADALLASFRVPAGPDTASLSRWARDLLADTRLLLDSPAAADAARRRLLQDLELTLAQIVQLSAATSPDDRSLVDRSLQRGELLTRIRNAVPLVLSGT